MPRRIGRQTSTSSARRRWRRWNCRSWAAWSTAAPSPRRSGRTRPWRALPPRRTGSSISCVSTGTRGRRRAPTAPSPGSRSKAVALPIWPWATSTSTAAYAGRGLPTGPTPAVPRAGASTSWGTRACWRERWTGRERICASCPCAAAGTISSRWTSPDGKSGRPWRRPCRRRRRRMCAALSSPGRAARGAWTCPPWRPPSPLNAMYCSSGTRPARRRIFGSGRGRTPCGGCSSGTCGGAGRPPATRRSGGRSPWRCASAWRPWTVGT